MLPLRFFRSRGFSAANARLVPDVLRHVRRGVPPRPVLPGRPGPEPVPVRPADAALDGDAGLRRADRRASSPAASAAGRSSSPAWRCSSAGLAWIAAVITPTVEYTVLVPGLRRWPASGWACSSPRSPTSSCPPVRPIEEGQASGANNTIREIGGVFGVAVLATVFSSAGSYLSPTAFVDGLVPAVWVGAAIVARRRGRGAGAPGRAGSRRRGDVPVAAPTTPPATVPRPARADRRLNSPGSSSGRAPRRTGDRARLVASLGVGI